MGPDDLSVGLASMFLDPNYRGYKHSFAPKIASLAGLTIEQLDEVYEKEGEDAFIQTIRDAAEKHAVTPDQFVKHLDSVGVEWGITVDGTHNNQKTGELVRAYPNKFKGFIFVDPNQGMKAVRELEVSVKEYGLHALYLTAFRTKLPADHKKNYPLYAKACELGIPVHIYCSINFSKAVPYDLGHPRYVDQVARDFPELKIMASVSGFPWVLDFMGIAMRHENVYLNFETWEPAKMDMRGSGYEPYLHFAENSLKHKICFASNWTSQGEPVEDIIAHVDALPFSDSTKDRIFYENARVFYEEL